MSIGVAIIGAGIFAQDEHLPAVKVTKTFSLKAIYSRSLKTAQTLACDTDVDLYSEDSESGRQFKHLLIRSDISAVIIALPILAQPEYIKAALAAGKHVLSEKPIAKDLKTAQELIGWYRSSVDTSKVVWAVAENFRYYKSFEHAVSVVQTLGRILTFRARMQTLTMPGGRYYETEWRKVPGYQGGFLLDGGIHFVAGIRMLLSSGSDHISRLVAMTAQLQEHLPPVDTVDATARTKAGAIGSISISFGTTMKGSEWSVGCERGSVTVNNGIVTTVIDGREEQSDIGNESNGVPSEIRAFGDAIHAGVANVKQSPEEALADLEILEKMLRSGEGDGLPMDCQLQTSQ